MKSKLTARMKWALSGSFISLCKYTTYCAVSALYVIERVDTASALVKYKISCLVRMTFLLRPWWRIYKTIWYCCQIWVVHCTTESSPSLSKENINNLSELSSTSTPGVPISYERFPLIISRWQTSWWHCFSWCVHFPHHFVWCIGKPILHLSHKSSTVLIVVP